MTSSRKLRTRSSSTHCLSSSLSKGRHHRLQSLHRVGRLRHRIYHSSRQKEAQYRYRREELAKRVCRHLRPITITRLLRGNARPNQWHTYTGRRTYSTVKVQSLSDLLVRPCISQQGIAALATGVRAPRNNSRSCRNKKKTS